MTSYYKGVLRFVDFNGYVAHGGDEYSFVVDGVIVYTDSGTALVVKFYVY